MMSVNVMVTPYEKDNLKGLASVKFGSSVKLNGIRIMENNKDGKLFVSMPSYKTKDGSYKEHFHPITKEFKEALDQKILDAYDAKICGVAKESEPVVEPEITNARATSFRKDNIRGLGTVVLDDAFVMNGIKVMRGEYGLFASMPSYKGTDGNYHDYVEFTPEFKKSMNQSLVKAMQNPQVKAEQTKSAGESPYQVGSKLSPEQATKEGFTTVEDGSVKAKLSKAQAKPEKAKQPDIKQTAKQQPVKVM